MAGVSNVLLLHILIVDIMNIYCAIAFGWMSPYLLKVNIGLSIDLVTTGEKSFQDQC